MPCRQFSFLLNYRMQSQYKYCPKHHIAVAIFCDGREIRGKRPGKMNGQVFSVAKRIFPESGSKGADCESMCKFELIFGMKMELIHSNQFHE
jgi:hypothetical protein